MSCARMPRHTERKKPRQVSGDSGDARSKPSTTSGRLGYVRCVEFGGAGLRMDVERSCFLVLVSEEANFLRDRQALSRERGERVAGTSVRAIEREGKDRSTTTDAPSRYVPSQHVSQSPQPHLRSSAVAGNYSRCVLGRLNRGRNYGGRRSVDALGNKNLPHRGPSGQSHGEGLGESEKIGLDEKRKNKGRQ